MWKLDRGFEDETKEHWGFLSECVILPTPIKAIWRFPLGNGVSEHVGGEYIIHDAAGEEHDRQQLGAACC